MELQDKYKKLQDYLRDLGSVAVAFSSGVDSTFLLAAAVDTLGKENVMAVTASSCSFPERELKEAQAFCKERGIRHVITASEELDIDGFRHNPKNRCYLCKHELFEKIWQIAKENGMNTADAATLKNVVDKVMHTTIPVRLIFIIFFLIAIPSYLFTNSNLKQKNYCNQNSSTHQFLRDF